VDVIGAGRTLYLLAGPPHPPQHLWVVLTDSDPKTNHVVIVMIVTSHDYTDKTVTLNAGSHPFIVHESNVDYRTATLALPKKLNAAIANGRCRLEPDVSPDMLAAIRAGLRVSSRTPNYIVDHCTGRF
jgi:hypothetical protein